MAEHRKQACNINKCHRKARYSDGLCEPHHKQSKIKQHGNYGKYKNNLVGKKFHMLKVVERLSNTKDRRARYKCVCDCGNETIARGDALNGNRKKSCGGLHRKSHGEASSRNGKQSPEYSAWAGMIQRCENKNTRGYHHYGGRGIKIDKTWRKDYLCFLGDVGRRPTKKHSLDRIDVNGNYEPGNVRWATSKQQQQNRRPFQYKGWRESAKHAWNIVKDFERVIASYTGAPYAVAVDSCTNALLLSCAYYFNSKNEKDKVIEIPRFTYNSVPMSIRNAGGKVKFRDENWKGQYQLKPYQIYDSARLFTSNMYKPGTMICLSFHWTKHLHIGHGGAIITDNEDAVEWLKRARHDGRQEKVAPKNDTFLSLGWHVSMSPVSAAQGLLLMAGISEHNDPLPWGEGTDSDYPDLSKFKVFK